MTRHVTAAPRAAIAAAIAAVGAAGCSTGDSLARVQLGALVFSDPSLSLPAGQSCADCHVASMAFRDRETSRSTSMGAVAGRFGARNAQSAMYASHVPPLHRDG